VKIAFRSKGVKGALTRLLQQWTGSRKHGAGAMRNRKSGEKGYEKSLASSSDRRVPGDHPAIGPEVDRCSDGLCQRGEQWSGRQGSAPTPEGWAAPGSSASAPFARQRAARRRPRSAGSESCLRGGIGGLESVGRRIHPADARGSEDARPCATCVFESWVPAALVCRRARASDFVYHAFLSDHCLRAEDGIGPANHEPRPAQAVALSRPSPLGFTLRVVQRRLGIPLPITLSIRPNALQ
jgi:hypothetical protein